VTPEWLERVNARLAVLDKGPTWLEKEAHMAKGAVSKLLEGKQQTSNYVDAINDVLGLSLSSTIVVEDATEIEMLMEFRRRGAAEQAQIVGLLRLKPTP